MTFFRAFFDELSKLGSTYHFQEKVDLSKSPDPDWRDDALADLDTVNLSWRARRKRAAKGGYIRKKRRE